MGKKAAASRLDAAHDALGETNKKIAALDAAKVDALLADRDDQAAQCEAKAQELKRLASVQNEKIRLLQAEAERQAAEYRARERLAKIERNEATLTERAALAAEATAGIEQADQAMRRMCELNRNIRAAWNWETSDVQACLLADGPIISAIEHELFRVGHRPFLGGGMDGSGVGLSFPGGRAPRLELRDVPGRQPPLADVMRTAGECASKVMRSGVSTSSPDFAALAAPVTNGNGAAVPQPATASIETSPPPGASATTLAELLARQNTLAADPSREAEYLEVVKQISALQ
jgi:hypothetical protein